MSLNQIVPPQMFKILGLLCLSTAYALSVMYLQGVKLSDSQVGGAGGALHPCPLLAQRSAPLHPLLARRAAPVQQASRLAVRGRPLSARLLHPAHHAHPYSPPPPSPHQATLSGVLTAGMFFFISNAKPLAKLSPDRPHPSIFNLYFFGSLLGQFAAQLAFLIWMYRAALAAMPADDKQDSDSDFKPNLVNSVCYLVEQVGCVRVCVKGRGCEGRPRRACALGQLPHFGPHPPMSQLCPRTLHPRLFACHNRPCS